MLRAGALLALLFVPVVLAAPGKPRVIHLTDGSKVIGRVVENECTEDVLVVSQLRGGAKRRVPWKDIKPDLAQALKVQLGFAVAAGEEGGLTVQGVEIRNRAGTDFSGLLLNPKTAERDGFYHLKTADGERKIRLSDVKTGPDEVELDADEVYTPDELYERELKKKEPVTAEDHFLLAELARIVGALDKAKLHYEKLLELDDQSDPKYQAEKIKRRLEMVNKLLASQGALDELREIKKSIVFRKYKKASDQLEAFRAQYGGDKDLADEALALEEELKKKRSKHFISQVPNLTRKMIKELLLKKVREKDITLREAQQYALPRNQRREFLKGVRGGGKDASVSESVTEEAMAAVGEKLGIKRDEVLAFWEQRSKRSTFSAFYRDGTFAVLEEVEDALAKAPKVKAKKGKKLPKLPKPKKRKEPEDWWEGKVQRRKYSELRDWLYAWWAEKSGFCEVLDPRAEVCPACNGKGYVSHMLTGTEGTVPFYDRCQTCYEAKHWRVVRFK